MERQAGSGWGKRDFTIDEIGDANEPSQEGL
jgi:hypothetical protein